MKPTNKKEQEKAPAFIEPIEKMTEEVVEENALEIKKPTTYKVIVEPSAIYSRPNPAQESVPTGTIIGGTVLTVTEEKGEFGKTERGWIKLKFTKKM